MEPLSVQTPIAPPYPQNCKMPSNSILLQITKLLCECGDDKEYEQVCKYVKKLCAMSRYELVAECERTPPTNETTEETTEEIDENPSNKNPPADDSDEKDSDDEYEEPPKLKKQKSEATTDGRMGGEECMKVYTNLIKTSTRPVESMSPGSVVYNKACEDLGKLPSPDETEYSILRADDNGWCKTHNLATRQVGAIMAKLHTLVSTEYRDDADAEQKLGVLQYSYQRRHYKVYYYDQASLQLRKGYADKLSKNCKRATSVCNCEDCKVSTPL